MIATAQPAQRATSCSHGREPVELGTAVFFHGTSPLRGLVDCVAPAFHGLTGVLKKAPYVSPSGYVVVCCGLGTQGGALFLDELGTALALGYSMESLRGMFCRGRVRLFQQALAPVATHITPPAGARTMFYTEQTGTCFSSMAGADLSGVCERNRCQPPFSPRAPRDCGTGGLGAGAEMAEGRSDTARHLGS